MTLEESRHCQKLKKKEWYCRSSIIPYLLKAMPFLLLLQEGGISGSAPRNKSVLYANAFQTFSIRRRYYYHHQQRKCHSFLSRQTPPDILHRNKSNFSKATRWDQSMKKQGTSRLETSIRSNDKFFAATRLFQTSTSEATKVTEDVKKKILSQQQQQSSVQEKRLNEPIPPPPPVSLSFSHIHMYVDHLESLEVYKELENNLNTLAEQHSNMLGKSGIIVNDCSSASNNDTYQTRLDQLKTSWNSLTGAHQESETEVESIFVTQKRDIVKQMLAGFGFRIIAASRTPNNHSFSDGERNEDLQGSSSYRENQKVTRTTSFVLSSPDQNGVQFVITSLSGDANGKTSEDVIDENEDGKGYYHHLDASYIKQFYNCHDQRQGIAVLSFQVTSSSSSSSSSSNDHGPSSRGGVDAIYERYNQYHPNLLVHSKPITYKGNKRTTKILDVYAYYAEDDDNNGTSMTRVEQKQPDKGTMLRFIEVSNEGTTINQNDTSKTAGPTVLLPGLSPVDATFDHTCQEAYCDHWVSNVLSRTGFIEILKDTLGFTPKVNFNAGVIAAGESQIESTVTGNDPTTTATATATTIDVAMTNANSTNKQGDDVLRDQSQVYLPINNALSPVGHVNGFLTELGQGVQHIASRVQNLTNFVQRANDYRQITNEGFTFLNIPRSYYGVLSSDDIKRVLVQHGTSTTATDKGVDLIMDMLTKRGWMTPDGAVDLNLSYSTLENDLFQRDIKDVEDEKQRVTLLATIDSTTQDTLIQSILQSRYKNLKTLLGDSISDEEYMGLVRNRILVDVQGSDLLFQIFTCNILQRQSNDEAPFLEFIQRGCGGGSGSGDGTKSTPKPGCGGFGIRNFLTLFLSIEVSKAMANAIEATQNGNARKATYYQTMVQIFTDQLNESNPILNGISDAMTDEGYITEQLHQQHLRLSLLNSGDPNNNHDDDIQATIQQLEEQQRDAEERKRLGNERLMKCSEYYRMKMANLRSSFEEQQTTS